MKRYLLDTHVAYWWMTGSKKLSKSTAQLISASPCAVSVASIWEMQLKNSLGKLALPSDPLHLHFLAEGFSVLPITAEHVERAREMRGLHNDPFDSLIIAIADLERLTLLTKDSTILSLGLKHILEA